MEVRKPDMGVFPPTIDPSDLRARVEYIAQYFNASNEGHAKEFAATLREALAKMPLKTGDRTCSPTTRAARS